MFLKKIALLFSCLFTFILSAQEVPKILNFSKNDYKAQNQNWAIGQNPTHEMCFGNGDGLLTFDGSFWRTFTLPNNQIVRSVASDTEGKVFVGGFAEFGFWQREADGQFKYHSLIQNVADALAQKEEIWHILIKGRNVYFQSFSTIYHYDYAKVKTIKPPGSIMFLQSVHDKLLLQVISQGLFELTPADTFKFVPKSEIFAKTIVSTIINTEGGQFLVGTTKAGVFIFQNGEFQPWASPLQKAFKDFQINKGVRLKSGNLAFGTILNGVFILKPDGKLLYHLNKENGLQNNTVISMFEDKAQNLWLGLDKGIDLIDLNAPLKFFQDRSGRTGAVYAASFFDNTLYIGTNQGVFFWEKNKAQFTLVAGTQGQVWDLKVFDNQLICGHNNGVLFIQKGAIASKIQELTGVWQSLRHPQLPHILLQATYTGIIILEKNPNSTWFFKHKIDNYDAPTKKIAFDKSGNLWALNAYNQLFKLKLSPDLKQAQVQPITVSAQKDKIDFDTFGDDLLFKSVQNFYRFDAASDMFLFEKKFVENCKWRTLNGATLKIFADYVELKESKKRLRLRLIPDYETIIALDSSRLLFGLDDGYAIFDSRETPTIAAAMPQSMLYLKVKDGRIFSITKSKDNKNVIKLPPQYRTLEMSFALPIFTDLPKFRYRLSHISDYETPEWSMPDATTRREFVNLTAGKYIFELKEDITDKEMRIEFEISPYWYETTFAKCIYALLFLAILFLFRQYHKRQLERQFMHLESEKKRELEQQRIKSDNEKLHIEVVNKSKDLANSTMSIIRKNDILMSIGDALEEIKKEMGNKFPEKYQSQLKNMISTNIAEDENWRVFEENFNEVHHDFLQRLKLKYPELTPGDLKLAAYLRMNLSTKEISPIMYMSIRGVENKRYRLRKRIGLSEEINLTEFLMQF